MSAQRIESILADFTGRLNGVDRVENGIGMFIEFAEALARQGAEMVFFKVQAEPGWTEEAALNLADIYFHGHAIAIADTLQAHGGTVEMAQDVVKAAASAYGSRFVELYAGIGQGGSA